MPSGAELRKQHQGRSRLYYRSMLRWLLLASPLVCTGLHLKDLYHHFRGHVLVARNLHSRTDLIVLVPRPARHDREYGFQRLILQRFPSMRLLAVYPSRLVMSRPRAPPSTAPPITLQATVALHRLRTTSAPRMFSRLSF
jgi:hypothetical protein